MRDNTVGRWNLSGLPTRRDNKGAKPDRLAVGSALANPVADAVPSPVDHPLALDLRRLVNIRPEDVDTEQRDPFIDSAHNLPPCSTGVSHVLAQERYDAVAAADPSPAFRFP